MLRPPECLRRQFPHCGSGFAARREQMFALALDERGIQRGVDERRRAHEPPEKFDIRAHADDLVLRERRAHAGDGLGARGRHAR